MKLCLLASLPVSSSIVLKLNGSVDKVVYSMHDAGQSIERSAWRDYEQLSVYQQLDKTLTRRIKLTIKEGDSASQVRYCLQ